MLPGKDASMLIFLDHARDLIRLNLLGTALLRLFGRGGKRASVLDRVFSSGKNTWYEGSDGTAIGVEASWAGVFPRRENEDRSGRR